MQIDLYSKELSHYLDKLRFSRNISLEEMTFDIVSLRQFRRYLRGEYQMPQVVFNKLSKRLGFKPEHLLLEFESMRLEETEQMNVLHNYVVNKNYDGAKLLISKIDPNYIVENNNLLMYKYSLLLLDYYLSKINHNFFISTIKELINYDLLFDKSILSSTEVILLTSLLPIPNFKDKLKIISLLENFIGTQKTIVSGHNDRLILLCLYYLSDYYGVQGNYDLVIKNCQKGIDFCNYLKYNYLLEDFYYYSAFTYYALGEKKKSDDMLFRCFCIINAQDNRFKTKKYRDLIEDDFKINLDYFVIEYLKNR